MNHHSDIYIIGKVDLRRDSHSVGHYSSRSFSAGGYETILRTVFPSLESGLGRISLIECEALCALCKIKAEELAGTRREHHIGIRFLTLVAPNIVGDCTHAILSAVFIADCAVNCDLGAEILGMIHEVERLAHISAGELHCGDISRIFLIGIGSDHDVGVHTGRKSEISSKREIGIAYINIHPSDDVACDPRL